MLLAGTPRFQRVRVTAVRGGDGIAHRLMELGVLEGSEVEIVGCAPLGDPLHVRVGDYELSLRSTEASRVEVAPA
jgi:ferrous iron transport protein A